MNTRYAILNSQQSSLVLASHSRDIVFMSWPAYRTDARFYLVRLEGDRVQVIENGGVDRYKKMSEEHV